MGSGAHALLQVGRSHVQEVAKSSRSEKASKPYLSRLFAKSRTTKSTKKRASFVTKEVKTMQTLKRLEMKTMTKQEAEKQEARFKAAGWRSCEGAGAIGSSATLDQSGYVLVERTCCNSEMYNFVRRVIDMLDFDVCDEGGVMGLVPWFTCETT